MLDPDQLDPERHLSEETLALYYPLVEDFGEEMAKQIICRLMEAVGGQRYYINAATQLHIEQASRTAVELLSKGLVTTTVARRTGLRRAHVEKLHRAMRS